MPVLVEHRAILPALVTALGTDILQQPAMLVIGWSTPETLVLQPEWAVLSLQEKVPYLRLPVSLAAIESALAKAITRGESTGYQQLRYPLYQLQHSLRQLRNETDSARARRRLREIRRFVLLHWPALVPVALGSLEQALPGERADALLTQLQAALPALPWSASCALVDREGKLRAPILDEFEALEGALVNRTLVPDLAPLLESMLRSSAGWWDTLQHELAAETKALEQWGATLFAPRITATVRELADATADLGTRLDQWLASPAAFSEQQLAEWQDAMASMRARLEGMRAGYREMCRVFVMLAKG